MAVRSPVRCQAAAGEPHFHRCQDASFEGSVACSAGRVGVTGGWSYLGIEIVRLLLRKGYYVRAIVHTNLDRDAKELAVQEFLKELDPDTARRTSEALEIVECDLMSFEDASAAFEDCVAIFHTASFVDPNSISGFTEPMVNAEVIGTSNAVAACAKSDTVRRLILTSSAATLLWSDKVPESCGDSIRDITQTIRVPSSTSCSCQTRCQCFYQLVNLNSNADIWSDPERCRQKKLWFALAKTEAEKAAWALAAEMGLEMLSVGSALITGPNFVHKNTIGTIAYLKGAKEMMGKGLLAKSCVRHVAHAHIWAFERPSSNRRYFCFDDFVSEASRLELAAALAPIYVFPQ